MTEIGRKERKEGGVLFVLGTEHRAGDMALLVKCSTSPRSRVLYSDPMKKPGMAVHTCNPVQRRLRQAPGTQ